MVQCCRCNGGGLCKNCSCVKAGKACIDCLPSKKQRCSNLCRQRSVTPPHPQLSPPNVHPSEPTTLNSPPRAVSPQLSTEPEALPANSSHGLGSELSVSVSVPLLVPTNSNNLPDFHPASNPTFVWGSIDSASFTRVLDSAYNEAVHWKNNLFKIPQGNAGKSFTAELSRLFSAFATGSALEQIALKAATVLPLLMLQKPCRSSKTNVNIKCLVKRLELWKEGDLTSLLREGRAIQARLPKAHPRRSEKQLSRSFANLMFQGKTQAALQLLSNKGKGGVLHLSDVVENSSISTTVKDVLKSKHPDAVAATSNSIINGSPPVCHPVIFESIDAALIRSTSLNTHGAAGPSGLDAYAWRRLCTSFKSASNSLCESLALTARRLCSVYVDPSCVSSLLASRLIALDKNPGVRPIGIGETPRRIIAKAVLTVTRGDIQDTAGSVQLCAGQIAGVEAAVHAVQDCFQQEGTEAVLLVDASNAFNSLNRDAALHNIRFLCPSISTMLINTHRVPTELFIDGEVIFSREGTTQGDPLAMPMYAIATIPLIRRLSNSVTQVWYADDAAALGSVSELRNWWDNLVKLGPDFGYFANSTKTWLVTKDSCLSSATAAFAGTNVNITSSGRPYLGAPLGSSEYSIQFAHDKVEHWSNELKTLSEIAITQPHAAYAAFTHGFYSKWSHLSRTMPNMSRLFQPLENILRTVFIPTITGRPAPNDTDRDVLAVPTRLGGLGLYNPAKQCDLQFSASLSISKPLIESILLQDSEYSSECLDAQMSAKSIIKQQRREQTTQAAEDVKQHLTPAYHRVLDLAGERGASNWLTSLPITEFGFSLHKGAFVDALCLRYGWPPPGTPTHCACGANFSVEHVFSCPRGGFPSIRHNEIRDITANLLTEVCHDVLVEPNLQSLTGEALAHRTSNVSEGARLDVSVNGFWGGRHEKTFLDVRMFNPHAPSNKNSSISNCYKKHENEKKRAYEQRIRNIEHSSFTPLVLSATGGMAKQSTTFYKRLASLLADKWEQPYSSTLYWLRVRLSFSLLRSAIHSIRGARSSRGHAEKSPLPIDLISREASLQ